MFTRNKSHKFIKWKAHKPGWIERLFLLVGVVRDPHSWQEYKRKSERMVYLCRRCKCGAEQIKYAGLRGDKQWHDISEPFRYKWEREDFELSVDIRSRNTV